MWLTKQAIEKGFREWIKIMQNIEDRMLATREWHIPAQMTVAHIYFDVSAARHLCKLK